MLAGVGPRLGEEGRTQRRKLIRAALDLLAEKEASEDASFFWG